MPAAPCAAAAAEGGGAAAAPARSSSHHQRSAEAAAARESGSAECEWHHSGQRCCACTAGGRWRWQASCSCVKCRRPKAGWASSATIYSSKRSCSHCSCWRQPEKGSAIKDREKRWAKHVWAVKAQRVCCSVAAPNSIWCSRQGNCLLRGAWLHAAVGHSSAAAAGAAYCIKRRDGNVTVTGHECSSRSTGGCACRPHWQRWQQQQQWSQEEHLYFQPDGLCSSSCC